MNYQEAASFWEDRDKTAAAMDRALLLQECEEFALSHTTCALATGTGEFVRCTPIEYTYRNGCFWMLSEGGKKFAALEKNRSVSLAIYDPYEGFGKLGGMQVTGEAALIEPWSTEYTNLLAWKKIPEAALRKLDHPMYLIRVTPVCMEILCSEFKNRGFDVRQRIDFQPMEEGKQKE